MPKLFGTDGVRGVANADLTADLALALGRAAGTIFSGPERSARIVIGRDTRISGEMLEAAMVSGILSVGGSVLRCGVMPTPAVAFLTVHLGCDAGIVISASHNPVQDNGIKFFDASGYKLSDELERQIEELLGSDFVKPTGARVGRVEDVGDAESLYVDHALRALEGQTLEGFKIVADCANGAAFRTTPMALRKAGADVVVMNVDPNGVNINVDSGSTSPEAAGKRVVEEGATAGIAHDGDADRVIALDEQGNIVDGDAMIAAMAVALKKTGALQNNTVVTTVMANLGFRKAMARESIEVLETDVGDRYVGEAMRKTGASIGGEQSGHVIFHEFSTTGDGLITALRLLKALKMSGTSMSQLASIVEKFPQVLINVKVGDKDSAMGSLEDKVAEISERLGKGGRVLVRPSGTEPVVRVMVEAETEILASKSAEEIARFLDGSGGEPIGGS